MNKYTSLFSFSRIIAKQYFGFIDGHKIERSGNFLYNFQYANAFSGNRYLMTKETICKQHLRKEWLRVGEKGKEHCFFTFPVVYKKNHVSLLDLKLMI